MEELTSLGASDVRETVAGVHFFGARAVGYRACLWSRLANRVLWPLGQVAADNADTLYRELFAIAWGDYFTPARSIAIDFSGENREIRNTQFGAQRCKDAVVDWFKANADQRPDVDRANADVRINVRLVRDRAQIAFDFSGSSLHQRGYRLQSGAAPMKENLAAAVLLRADWPGVAARGGALIDPMCGAGTLLLEAALMVADIAPGLHRQSFGFEGLLQHDESQWQALLADATGRAERGRAAQLPEMRGYDDDREVVRRAWQNIARSDLQQQVRVSHKPLAQLIKPTHKRLDFGLIVCNPPYGERLARASDLPALYNQLGEIMQREFTGWQAAILTTDIALGKAVGLRSHQRYRLFNGAIPVNLLLFELRDNHWRALQESTKTTGVREPVKTGSDNTEQKKAATLSPGAQMFANRITKNRRRLKNWLQRDGVTCYRVYDADMPEYAVAIDLYHSLDEGDYVHVAEYRAPSTVSPESAAQRLQDIQVALPQALDVDATRIVYKQRARQRGAQQYQRRHRREEWVQVREGSAKLLVNLHDYLDTGLFLDHRPLRLRIGAQVWRKDFLNLYCYTGSATVHAALGGARSTTSVDTSNTYLAWLKKNLSLNGLLEDGGERVHRQVRSDSFDFLHCTKQQFDVVLLDPPSFSNSKSREASFDVQRDHVELLSSAMARLKPDGQLYFSNNRRGFKLDASIHALYACQDITAQTLDPDFDRGRPAHQCWLLQHSLPE